MSQQSMAWDTDSPVELSRSVQTGWLSRACYAILQHDLPVYFRRALVRLSLAESIRGLTPRDNAFAVSRFVVSRCLSPYRQPGTTGRTQKGTGTELKPITW